MRLNKNAIEHIELCLKQLSDKEFQERVWLRGEGPEVSSYAEVVCQLFDDTALGDMLEAKKDEPVLSEEIDSIMIDLGKIFDEIDYRTDTKDILNHPSWLRVRKLSSDALKLFRRSRGSGLHI